MAIRAIRVNDGGDFVVRRDGQEFRFELVALTDIDVVRTIGQATLFSMMCTLWPFGVAIE